MLVAGCGSATASAAPTADIAKSPGSPLATFVVPAASDATPESSAGPTPRPESSAGPPPTPYVDPRTGLVGCSLYQYHGDLVAENGAPVLKPLGDWGARSGTVVSLDWPEGWTIRPTDGGQLDVLNRDGSVQVRTGTHVILLTSDYLKPFNRDDELIVCGADPYPF